MSNYPQFIAEFILDTVFPIKCISCQEFSTGSDTNYLCLKCSRIIPTRKSFECIGCKITTPYGKTCLICRKSYAVDQLLIVTEYKNVLVEKILKTIKYRLIQEAAKSLRPTIVKYIYWLEKTKEANLLADNPLLVPVPLHYRRFNARGFNQSEIFAQILSDIYLTENATNILTRIRYTPPQAEIKSLNERSNNLGHAFKTNAALDIRNRNIILVDDICTTGTTLNQCAIALKLAGAKKVTGFVIARS